MYELFYFIYCDLNFFIVKYVYYYYYIYYDYYCYYYYYGWGYYGWWFMNDKKRKVDEKDIEENDERKLMEWFV